MLFSTQHEQNKQKLTSNKEENTLINPEKTLGSVCTVLPKVDIPLSTQTCMKQSHNALHLT